MNVLLGVAVFGPVVLLPLDRRRVRVGALVVAVLWLAVAVAARDAELGRFAAGAAPAAAGTWLLVASIRWPTSRSTVVLTVLMAALGAGGAAFASQSHDVNDAIGALALAAAIGVVAARTEGDGGLAPAAVAVLGTAAMALGSANDTELLLFVGAPLVAGAAAWRPRRAGVVLLPLALALSFVAIPLVPWWPVVVVAGLALALADRPAVALALLAVVAIALGTDAVVAGAPAVLVAASLHPAVALAALPGVAIAVGVADLHDSRWLWVLAVLAALTGARLWRRPDDVVPGRPSPVTVVAMGLGGWLLVAPETWSDSPALTSWGRGSAIALVAGVVGAFMVASFTEAAVVVPELEVGDPPYPPRDQSWSWRVAIVTVVILAIAGGALVASALS